MTTLYTLTHSNAEENTLHCTGTKDGTNFLEFTLSGNAEKNDLDIALECAKQAMLSAECNYTVNIEHKHYTAAAPGATDQSAHVPALEFYGESYCPRPVALCVHGLNSSKLQTIQGALQMAKEGYYVILIDAALHGERRSENPTMLNMGMDPNFIENFVGVIKDTARDISAIIDQIGTNSNIDSSRIGLTGNSMGGFISFLAATKEPRIKAIAPLVASPDWSMFFDHPHASEKDQQQRESIVSQDPLNNYVLLRNTAVLIQNNDQDPIVSVEGARKIDPKLKELFFDMPERYSYIEYNKSGHTVSSEMFDNVIDWFNTFV